MVIGVLQIELFIPESGSLKTKRFAIKSIKDRVKNRFNASIAEIDYTDKWQRSTLGIVTVSNEMKHAESVLVNVIKQIYGDHRVEVLDSSINYL